MIIVTGATGQLGAQIVERLLERVPAEQVGVSVRDSARAQPSPTAACGSAAATSPTRARSTPRSRAPTQVLVISSTDRGDDAVAQHHGRDRRRLRAGAERILYTSHQARRPGLALRARARPRRGRGLPRAVRPPVHLAAQRLLRHHACSSTSATALETGELGVPADGPVSWTARADLADGGRRHPRRRGAFDGPTPPLTASATVDLEDVASILSVRHVVIEDGDFVSALTSHGTPEPIAQMLLGSYLASRAGEFAVTDPTLATLIGGEPQSVRAALQP